MQNPALLPAACQEAGALLPIGVTKSQMPSGLPASHSTDNPCLVAAGRCVILTHQKQRTMRTCLSNAVRLAAEDLSPDDFRGSRWWAGLQAGTTAHESLAPPLYVACVYVAYPSFNCIIRLNAPCSGFSWGHRTTA